MKAPSKIDADANDHVLRRRVHLIANALKVGSDRDTQWAIAATAVLDGVNGHAPKHFSKALEKSEFDGMNKIRLLTAHKVFTNGGFGGFIDGSPGGFSYSRAACAILALRPAVRKIADENRIVQLRKDFERLFVEGKRDHRRKNKIVQQAYEYACEKIEKCKGDQWTLFALALESIAAIKL